MKMELAAKVRAALTECFASDPDLIANWHIEAGRDLGACVERTMRDLSSCDKSFQFYQIHDGDELVAYWGTEFGRFINLIFVKPSHRKREFMEEFWSEVKKSVSAPFYAGVYTKNRPAVDFYKKRGGQMETFQHDGHWVSAFTFQEVK